MFSRVLIKNLFCRKKWHILVNFVAGKLDKEIIYE